MTTTTFADLGVPAPLVAVLAADGKTEAFPIQADTLPDTLSGRDVLGRGKTGSGKTIAFSLPLVARLSDGAPSRGRSSRPRGLVLAPTRELATQIAATLKPLADSAGLAITTIFGGVSQSRQVAALRAGVDIVVACPGRLDDLMKQGEISLDRIEITVLDEADHMADLGFLPVVTRIMDKTPTGGQRMLFSATLDNGVDKLVKRFLQNEAMHSVDEATSHVAAMTHHVFEVRDADAKKDLVTALASGRGRRILFTRTKHQAKRLAKQLTSSGVPAVDLHGNLSQPARDRNLAAFGSGEVRVLVATDVAARGVHVDDVELVVHVDPPAEHKAYLHRSGRTARAGSAGDVVTVMLTEQAGDVKVLLRNAAITVTPQKVTADSPAVTELVGEPAERIAPTDAPAASGGGRQGGAQAGGGRSGAQKSGGQRRTQAPSGESAGGGRRRRGRGNGSAGDGAGASQRDGQQRDGQQQNGQGRRRGQGGQGGQGQNGQGGQGRGGQAGSGSHGGRGRDAVEGGRHGTERSSAKQSPSRGGDNRRSGGQIRMGDLVNGSTSRGLGSRRARG
ncbi:DEAD/DEAH box helicase [Leifsonia aquatica]|uniref:Superfamily II DNA/RNA helicase n=2 Tax=Leifsonia aquatica TaxID=144185 RepID=A0A7W4UZB8_LEIAQ|nr:superfamily II DNA/RNA helicase [Leifsonia aquatica]